MDMVKTYAKSILAWLAQNQRQCPVCKADASFFEVVSVAADQLHPDAADSKSIDTSRTATIARIKCGKCNFDGSTLVLEDAGII